MPGGFFPGAGGGGGSSDHAALTNRGLADAHPTSAVTGLDAALAGKLAATEKGAANGVATLDAGARVPAAQLPSYVDDVIEFANLGAFPGTGEAGKIYIALSDNKQYRWGGSSYIELIASPGTTDVVPEGAVNLYHTQARVRGTALTGLSTANATDVVAADTTLSGFGKLQAQLGNKQSPRVVVNVQAGTSYTLGVIDAPSGALSRLAMASASANTVTVPADVFTAGTVILISQSGDGMTTLVAGAGVVFQAPSSTPLASPGQYALWRIERGSSEVWRVNLIGGSGGSAGNAVTHSPSTSAPSGGADGDVVMDSSATPFFASLWRRAAGVWARYRAEYTWAGRPSAATYAGAVITISDTIFAGVQMYSDGANWIPVGGRCHATWSAFTANHTGVTTESAALDTQTIPAGFCNIGGVSLDVEGFWAFTNGGTPSNKLHITRINGGAAIGYYTATSTHLSARSKAILEVTGTAATNYALPSSAATTGYNAGTAAAPISLSVDFAAAVTVSWHAQVDNAGDGAICRRRRITVVFP